MALLQKYVLFLKMIKFVFEQHCRLKNKIQTKHVKNYGEKLKNQNETEKLEKQNKKQVIRC